MINSEGWLGWHATASPKRSTSGYFHLIKRLATLMSLAVVFGGSFALSTQSVEAKTSRGSSGRAKNILVPPPPPYIPTVSPSALGMWNAQAVTADADYAVVENYARTSRNSSGRAKNILVPPPPPYTPLMVPSALGMSNAQADAVVENPYSKYIFTHNLSDMPQVVQPNPYVSHYRSVQTRILKQIDSFDSEISSHEKEIGRLLNL